jgi:hypothetical protein
MIEFGLFIAVLVFFHRLRRAAREFPADRISIDIHVRIDDDEGEPVPLETPHASEGKAPGTVLLFTPRHARIQTPARQ